MRIVFISKQSLSCGTYLCFDIVKVDLKKFSYGRLKFSCITLDLLK